MISRVSSLLEPDEIITKESPRGRFVSVDWEGLAHRWAMDYDFSSSNTLTTWLAPRGTGSLFARLRASETRYAVTGSFASYRLAPIAEPRLAALYVDDIESAAQSLGLRPAETGGNVLLVVPFDPVAFERAEYDDGITYARVTQVLLDLMKGPGRGPAEAEAPSGVDAGQRGHMETIHDRNYIDARETLLDAVEALGPHGDAVVLVGAQAIYVNTEAEDASFAIFPFTYDAGPRARP